MKMAVAPFLGILLSIIPGLAQPLAVAGTADTTEEPYTVVWLIDGARSDILHRLAAEGRLPTIQKLFLNEGLDVIRGLTVFPTTSTNAYQSFLTGLFPGNAGIPYLARYSRPDQETVDYLSLKGVKVLNADFLNWYQLNDADAPFEFTQSSLFNHLSEHKTASIYSTFRRDATVQIPMLPLHAVWSTFVLGRYETLDRLAFNNLMSLYKKPLSRVPRFTLVAFLAIDEIAHKEGAEDPRTLSQFEALDRMLGEFWQLLKRQGIADKTYLVLVGDHGNHDIEERSYLRERLLKRGIAIRSRQMQPPYELAISARGVSAAIISVAGKTGWKARPTIEDLHHVPTVRKKGEVDLIEYLRTQPETDLLLVRDGNHRVRVYSADGEAEVIRLFRSGCFWYAYHLIAGSDPLHYMEDPKLAPLVRRSTPLTAAQWLPLTADKLHSDAIVQIGQVFTDGRAGDIVVVAKKEWVFRHEKANTHGTLLQEDMHIPIMIHGPGIAPQIIPYARSVDIMPTILAWYHRTSPYRDGQDLLRPDPPPTLQETRLARLEMKYLLEGKEPPHTLNLSRIIADDQARIRKLETVADRCRNGRVSNRLTRPDRPQKMRESTCEVVDLALKTAYEDLERLEALKTEAGRPARVTHAPHHPIQHGKLDRPGQ